MFDAVKRLVGLGPKEPRVLSEKQREEIRELIVEYLQERFAQGFTRDNVHDFVLDVLSDEMPEDELSAEIEAALPAVEAERTANMAQWPPVTDCDRLDEAFSQLKATGVLAEQNFWCCQTCASSDMLAVMKQARKSGAAVPRGFTYYHEQDTENAVRGDGVFLAYGAEQSGKSASIAIGHEVLEVLQEHGLLPEWDGSLKSRIFVPLDWKRRAPLPDPYREASLAAS